MRASNFIDALSARAPAEDRQDKLSLYGRLVGDWDMDAVVHQDDGSIHRGAGEIHFAWVLEGRAIQDVWILPGIFHGTTLRVYDPGQDLWHIIWSDPLHCYFARQIGRAVGPDIVQTGHNDSGELIRWSFRDLSADAFRWVGERSSDDGGTWQLQAEFRARRR